MVHSNSIFLKGWERLQKDYMLHITGILPHSNSQNVFLPTFRYAIDFVAVQAHFPSYCGTVNP